VGRGQGQEPGRIGGGKQGRIWQEAGVIRRQE